MGALLSICFKGKDTGLIEPKVPIRAKKRSSKSKPSPSTPSGSSSKRSSLTNQHLLSGTNAAPSPNYQGVEGCNKTNASQSPQSPRDRKSPFFGSPPTSPVEKNAPQKSSKKGFSRSFSLKDKKTKNQPGSLDRRMSLRMMGGGQPLMEDDQYERSNQPYNNNF